VVTVSHMGHRGEGVVQACEERGISRCFVPYTAPGDIARIAILSDRGDVVELVEHGPHRAPPTCPHAGVCGGCAVQHLTRGSYLTWKHGIVQAALDRQGLDIQVSPMVDAHGDGRRRASVHVSISGGRVSTGFMRARSHELVAIAQCPVLCPELSDAFDIAGALMVALTGICRAMEVQFTATHTGLDCNILGPRNLGYDQHTALTRIAQDRNLARLCVDGDPVLTQREPTIRMGRCDVILPAAAFLQATQRGEEVLSSLVGDRLRDAGNVADLFCGVGPFALRLSEHATIYAADSNAASLSALSSAANHTRGIKPVTTKLRDLFTDALTTTELNKFDAVVLDPPRAGARHQTRALADSDVPVVVSVSCDAASFARDARVLVEGGYTLEQVTPVDQFKWSAHVEMVGLFSRP